MISTETALLQARTGYTRLGHQHLGTRCSCGKEFMFATETSIHLASLTPADKR